MEKRVSEDEMVGWHKSVCKIFCFGLLDKDLGWCNKVVGVGLS